MILCLESIVLNLETFKLPAEKNMYWPAACNRRADTRTVGSASDLHTPVSIGLYFFTSFHFQIDPTNRFPEFSKLFADSSPEVIVGC